MFATAPGVTGASGLGWWLLQQRRRALHLLAPTGLLQDASMVAAGNRSITTSSSITKGRQADWMLEDTEGLRVTKHTLPEYAMSKAEEQSLQLATDIIERLTRAGCLALITGGWVRDKFLGRPSYDIDITTSATNAQLKRLFAHVIDLPRNTVKVPHGGERFEVSTFRGYSRSDGLISAAADAEARDFTINALYYCPRHRTVLDFVGGVADIEKRTLRLSSGILGDHVGRLIEDPLRVLRAVRFAVILDLKLAPDTAKLLTQHAYRCSVAEGVPPRRILLELRKLAAKDEEVPGTWSKCLTLIYHLGLLPHLFPWLRAGGGAGAQHAVRAAARLSARLSARCSGGGGGSGVETASESGNSEAISSSSSSSSSSNNRHDSGSSQAAKLPLELRVAALVHPGSSHEAYEQTLVYFRSRDERSTVETLAFAAQLAQKSPAPSTEQQQQQQPGGTAADEGWARVYGHEHGGLILEVLAAWMQEDIADRFLSHHARNRQRLAHLVAAAAGARSAERARAAAEEAEEVAIRRGLRRRAAGMRIDAVLDTVSPAPPITAGQSEVDMRVSEAAVSESEVEVEAEEADEMLGAEDPPLECEHSQAIGLNHQQPPAAQEA